MRKKIPHLTAIPRADGSTRYRWHAAPGLRSVGFKHVRLSDDSAEAQAQAEWINKAVAAWKTGKDDAVSAVLDAWQQGQRPRAPFLPVVLPGHGASAGAGGKHSISAMIDGYKDSRLFKELAPATRRDYANYLETWRAFMGDLPAGAVSRDMIEERYTTLLSRGKHHAANGAMRALSIVFSYGRGRFWQGDDPTKGVRLKEAPPRLRLITFAEEDAILSACRQLGLLDIAAVFMTAVYHGQRKVDILQLPANRWRTMPGELPTLTYDHSKTGAVVSAPVIQPHSAVLAAHMSDIEARYPDATARLAKAQQADRHRWGATPARTLIVDQTTGLPFDTVAGHFDKRWRQVRALAGKACPSIIGEGPDAPRRSIKDPRTGRMVAAGDPMEVKFLDTRDTAVTRLGRVPGSTDAWISSITGHSLTQIRNIMKHYMVVDTVMAEAAMEGLSNDLERQRIAEQRKA